MGRLLCRIAVIALCLFTASARAEEIAWGIPVDGVRVGLVLMAQEPDYGQPRFDVVVENGAAAEVVLPAAGSFFEKTDANGQKRLAQPLTPEILFSDYTRSTGVSSSTHADAPLLPTDTFVLKPGESRRFTDLRLATNWYTGDNTPRSRNKGGAQWALLPGASNIIVFHFENRQAAANGQNLWTGKATSGRVKVETPPASLDGFKIDADFTLPKTSYYLGEPMYAEFKVTNLGDKAITFPVDADYSGAGRRGRFRVVATDERGKVLPDKARGTGVGSDLSGGNCRLEPGASYTAQVPVTLWCPFDKPGRYELKFTRTLELAKAGAPYLHDAQLPRLTAATTIAVTLTRDEARKRELIASLPAMPRGHDYKAIELARDQLNARELAQDVDALPVLRTMLLAGSPYNREIIDRLRYYEDHKEAVIPLLVELYNSNKMFKREALAILSEWQAPEAVPYMLAMLKSPDATERREAVIMCYWSRDRAYLPTLLGLGNDPDMAVRAALGSALGAYGADRTYRDERVVTALRRLLQEPPPNYRVRLEAAKGLGKMGINDGIAVLIDLLRVDSKEVHPRQVREALRELTGESIDPDNSAPWLMWWKTKGKAKFYVPIGEERYEG